MKRLLFLGLSLVLLVVGVFIGLETPWLQDKLMARAIDKTINGYRRDIIADTEALNIIFCGTGSPMPSNDRAGSCIAVIAEGNMYLIDSGPRSSNNLSLWRIPQYSLQAVLLTHFHSDHIGSLGQINQASWIDNRRQRLRVYGGTGVEQIVDGFNQVYSANSRYRIEFAPNIVRHELSRLEAETIRIESRHELAPVIDTGDLKIGAFYVDHGVVKPSLGYKVEFKGRSFVVSGDTRAYKPMESFAKNVDVLIHEAMCDDPVQAFSRKLISDNRAAFGGMISRVKDYHTLPVDAAEIAKHAGVGALVFYHFIPPMENFVAEKIFLRGVKRIWDGEIKMSFDGLRIRLPVDSQEIQYLDVRP